MRFLLISLNSTVLIGQTAYFQVYYMYYSPAEMSVGQSIWLPVFLRWMTILMTKRSFVYVDGFNFYYGALRGGPYKWLNLERLFMLLRNEDEIQKVRYFTALINGRTRPNQDIYLRALETLPKVDIILGKFKNSEVECRVPHCKYPGSRWFIKPEEKRTDVNIGISLLDDGYRDLCDIVVVVSGDSDLVPAVNLFKQRFPRKQVIVYVPARDSNRGAAVELRSAADRHRTLPLNLLKRSQFPRRIQDGAGRIIEKPSAW